MKKLFLGCIALATLGSTYYLYNNFTSSQNVQNSNQSTNNKATAESTSKTNTNTQIEVKTQAQKEIPILNAIKQVALAQSSYSNEYGAYAPSIAKLSTNSKGSDVFKNMSNAIKKNVAYEGYLITELLNDADSEGTRANFGLFAKAVNPDKDKSCLLIMDLNKQQPFSEKNQDISNSKEIQIFESENPPSLTKWPSANELKNWTPIKHTNVASQPANNQP